MFRILITDPVHSKAVDYLKTQGFSVSEETNLDSVALKKKIPHYHALIGRTSTKITREIIEAAPELKCIGIHATGWDHIDIDATRGHGVLLFGYPPQNATYLDDRIGGSFIPVAEYVLMVLLATSKKLIEANSLMKNEQWNKYSLAGTELYGKTLGIIGLGRIGSLVADRAKVFGMRVIAYDEKLSEEEIRARGAEPTPLDKIYSEANFITVHIPNIKENVRFFNGPTFEKMKQQPVFINTSRAAVVDEQHLYEALENGLIKAAVLDVLGNAPNVNWDLVKHPHVIATPHIAGVTEESLERVSMHIATLVTDYLNYGKINGLIE